MTQIGRPRRRRPAATATATLTTMLALVAAPGALAGQAAQEGQATPPPESMAAVDLSALPPNIINMVLVKVNGHPILLSDLVDREEEQLSVMRQQFPEEEILAQLPILRARLLVGMIDERMLLQRADQLGITVDANQVDRQLEGFRDANGFTTDQELEAALAGMGLTVESVREQFRNRIRQQQLMFNEVQRQIVVTEAEIDRFYADNPADFTAAEQVRLEQVVFIGDPAAVADQAQAALADLRGGADPATLNASHPDATHFADTGTFIPMADLNEDLAAKIPNLETGVYSEPIRTNFGYSLVKVVERTERSTMPLAEVREGIRNRLMSEKSQERLDGYLGRLRERTILDIIDPRFDVIRDAWQSPPEEETGTS